MQFTLPVIGGNLFQLFYTLADSMIVGKTLGASSLAAVGATSIIVYFVLCFIQGMTNGFGIYLGQKAGEGKLEEIKKGAAASLWLSLVFTAVITVMFCGLAHPILKFMNTPEDIYNEAYEYMFIVLLGSGATFFYNMISNILRALRDSRTPLYYLVFSSLLNIVLDILFIVPFKGGVAGAAWATVLSQLLASLLCAVSGVRRYEELRLSRRDFSGLRRVCIRELKIGFPMGFQMSVMCIGQLAMQSAVNGFGSMAVAGYTAATKADQVSVLVNNATASALSAYVSQNYGAGKWKRIRQGVHAALIQTQCLNLMMGVGILLLRRPIVEMFLANPPKEVIWYSNGYLNWVAPCYLILGALSIYRCAVQSMQNTAAPFIACMIELVMRIGSTLFICSLWGYTGVCIATPLAWIGAGSYVMFVYYNSMQRKMLPADCLSDTVKG